MQYRCDGYEATRVIRQSTDPVIRNTIIIALTASVTTGDKELALSVGVDGYLTKPTRLKLVSGNICRTAIRGLKGINTAGRDSLTIPQEAAYLT